MLDEMPTDAADELPDGGSEYSSVYVPAGREARKFRRYYFRAHATATIYPEAGREGDRPQVCFVLTRDLSRSGISILHPVALAEGRRIDLEFPTGQKLAVAIKRVTALEAGCFLFGCRILGSD
jgi:hypothetical protein